MLQALRRFLSPQFTWVLPQADLSLVMSDKCLKRSFKSEPTTIDQLTLISQSLGFGGETAGFAACRAVSDGLDANTGYWWCLDPLTLVADIRTVVATEVPEELTSVELADIRSMVSELLPEGVRVEHRSAHLYLCLEEPWNIQTSPLSQVIGSSIDPYLPVGEDAKLVIRLMSEWQMALHALPLNQERQAQGRSAISGLWLWGGGVLVKPAPLQYDLVVTNDKFVKCLAEAAGLSVDLAHNYLINCDLSQYKSKQALLIDTAWLPPDELTPQSLKTLLHAQAIVTQRTTHYRRGWL